MGRSDEKDVSFLAMPQIGNSVGKGLVKCQAWLTFPVSTEDIDIV